MMGRQSWLLLGWSWVLAGAPGWAQPLLEGSEAPPPEAVLSVEARVARATALLAGGQPEAAIQLCQEGLGQDSTAVPLYTTLAAVYARDGRYSQAIEQLERALHFRPDYVLGHVNLGGIYTKLGQFQNAEPHLKKALELAPEQPVVLRRLGEFYLNGQQPGPAALYLRKAILLNPGDATLYFSLGKALEALGGEPDALVAYQQAARLDLGFEEAYFRAATLARKLDQAGYADSAMAVFGHLQELSARGLDQAKTLRELRKAVMNTPEDAQHNQNLGLFYAEQGYEAEALNQFERVLQLRPGDFRVLNRMGNILLHQQRLEEALEHYERAAQLAPDFALAHMNAGQACMQLKNPQEALAHYQQAVTLAPQVPVAWYYLALCHLALEQPAAADSVLDQALAVVRTEGKARQSLEELREKIRK